MNSTEGTVASTASGDDPAAYRPGPDDGWLTRKLHGFYVWRAGLRAHPLWGTLFAVILAVIGFAASVLWQWVQAKTAEPDQLLVEIKQKQDEEFRALRDGLDRLANGDTGAAREVRSAVDAIRSTNTTLIEQLALAREEYGRLQQVAEQGGEVQGGYDVILTPDTGMRIDAQNVLGIARIGSSSVWTTVTSGSAAPVSMSLQSGESIPYVSADGRQCRAALLSISQAGKAASFALACASA